MTRMPPTTLSVSQSFLWVLEPRRFVHLNVIRMRIAHRVPSGVILVRDSAPFQASLPVVDSLKMQPAITMVLVETTVSVATNRLVVCSCAYQVVTLA